jgi:hypothetical protein
MTRAIVMAMMLMSAVILVSSVAAEAQPLCMPAFDGSQGSEPYRLAYRVIESLGHRL